MHKDIKACLFLKSDAIRDFFTVKGYVLVLRYLALPESGAVRLHIGSLGEGTDCCRGQKRKVKPLLLDFFPDGEFRQTGKILLPDGSAPLPDSLIQARTDRFKKLSVGHIGFLLPGVIALADIPQVRKLPEFFRGEGKILLVFVLHFLFIFQCVGNMKKRA